MDETRISVPEDAAGTSSPHGSNDDWLGFTVPDDPGDTVIQRRGPMIPKVTRIPGVTEPNEICYEPLMVSIGPYHHEKPELQKMNDTKVTMARQFIRGSKATFQELYNEVAEVTKDAKQYYDEGAMEKLGDKKITQLMLLDGCFILQFIFCLLHENEKLKMASHVAALITRDILLLENQIPFPVLKSLMSLSFEDEDSGMKLIKDFIKHIRAMPRQRDSCRKRISKFFRKSILLLALRTPKGQTIRDEYHNARHLLEFFHMHFVDREVQIDRTRTTTLYRYHPAMELRRVGIHFKPSKTDQFTNVQFEPTLLAGRLKIPPLTIDDSTKSLLLNLVAYEEACLDDNVLWVTSYICFMDSLIDHPEDVRELRSQGILNITLGSEGEVAKLFNEVANFLVPNPYAFNKVKKGIESHYRNTFKRWILHYKGPFYTVIFKYSFLFGLIVSALKYVKVFPAEPLYGVCRLPHTNGTLYP